jgi:hypothetical protein
MPDVSGAMQHLNHMRGLSHQERNVKLALYEAIVRLLQRFGHCSTAYSDFIKGVGDVVGLRKAIDLYNNTPNENNPEVPPAAYVMTPEQTSHSNARKREIDELSAELRAVTSKLDEKRQKPMTTEHL